MDPRSKAEFDLAMAEFRKAIGQGPEPEVLLAQRIRAAYLGGGVIPSPTGRNSYHTHWAMAPAAARTVMGMHMTTWTEPTRWDRLKGTFFVRLRDFRRWLGSKIAGCECDGTW